MNSICPVSNPSPPLVVSDQDLVAHAQAGDASAMEVLLCRHAPRMQRLSLRICRGRGEDAEDCVQNAFLNAYRRLGSFRGEAQFSTWLVRIVVNECRMHWRRCWRERNTVGLDAGFGEDLQFRRELVDWRQDLEEQYAGREVEAMLEGCLAELSGSLRDVFVLREVRGLFLGEIAERIGVSLPAAKSRLHRARLLVQRCLGPKLGR